MANINNNNNAPNNLEELLKLAECAICCELKTDHRILVSCGHSFCKDDIQLIIDTRDLKCPLCRKPFTVPDDGVNSLIKDFHKIALVELALKWENSAPNPSTTEICSECTKPATRWCQEDQCLFCDGHAEEAHLYGKSKNHTLVAPSKKIVIVKCASHKKELEKFCRTCDKIICIDCFIFDHQKHKIDNADVVIAEKKSNLMRDWTAIEGPLKTQLLKEQQHLQQISAKEASKLQSLREQEEQYLQKSFEMIKSAEQNFVQELEEKKKMRENQISAKLEVVDRSLAEIKIQSQTLQDSMSHGNAQQWLIMEESVRKEFGKWSWEEKPEVEYQFEVQLPSRSLVTIATTDYQTLQSKARDSEVGKLKLEQIIALRDEEIKKLNAQIQSQCKQLIQKSQVDLEIKTVKEQLKQEVQQLKLKEQRVSELEQEILVRDFKLRNLQPEPTIKSQADLEIKLVREQLKQELQKNDQVTQQLKIKEQRVSELEQEISAVRDFKLRNPQLELAISLKDAEIKRLNTQLQNQSKQEILKSQADLEIKSVREQLHQEIQKRDQATQQLKLKEQRVSELEQEIAAMKTQLKAATYIYAANPVSTPTPSFGTTAYGTSTVTLPCYHAAVDQKNDFDPQSYSAQPKKSGFYTATTRVNQYPFVKQNQAEEYECDSDEETKPVRIHYRNSKKYKWPGCGCQGKYTHRDCCKVYPGKEFRDYEFVNEDR